MNEVEGLRFNLGDYLGDVQAAIDKAKKDKIVERIWQHDHIIWHPDPTEITNRLGWLDVATRMRGEVAAINAVVDQAKADGINHVLLLGMGGSSLAPELFSKVFGSKQGMQLGILDSTDPEAVRAQDLAHDPANTIYIVSSKSGGTVETFSFFKYFYNKAQDKLGNAAGSHFIAITDPGSGLAKTAEQHEFRRTFLADANIGGRYSALSHFGLVPAAFVGIDLEALLHEAEAMIERCKSPDANPGMLLGITMGALAPQGRDKLTFELPARYASFGDWAEQLVAESTGKQGKGILPVVGEKNPGGEDRLFVNIGTEAKDRPSIQVTLNNDYELGAQFFLWEFATAVAGYVLGINPFDQPNVEAAKEQARAVVDEYRETGKLPKAETTEATPAALRNFLEQAKPGDYLAIQAYAAHTESTHKSLQDLRASISSNHKVATTLGYGPRFLHSTGQLHKGDRGNGLFIQFVTTTPKNDLPIPNEAGKPDSEMSFGVLKVAQAIGDAQALRKTGRRVITFEVDDIVSAVRSLQQ